MRAIAADEDHEEADGSPRGPRGGLRGWNAKRGGSWLWRAFRRGADGKP